MRSREVADIDMRFACMKASVWKPQSVSYLSAQIMKYCATLKGNNEREGCSKELLGNEAAMGRNSVAVKGLWKKLVL